MTGEPTLHLVDQVTAILDGAPWPWAAAHRAAIEAHWAKLTAANPALYNGEVLICRERRLGGGRLDVRYARTDYAAFLTFRDLGFPDPASGNCFGMAALRGADGAFLLGVMGDHTANPGRIYFPAGTPEPADTLPDGRVDLLGNVLRELNEETGLTAEEVQVCPGWAVVVEGGRTALMREIRTSLPAEAVRARIVAFLAAQAQPELVDIRIVREPAQAEQDAVPRFVQCYLHHVFGQAGKQSAAAG